MASHMTNYYLQLLPADERSLDQPSEGPVEPPVAVRYRLNLSRHAIDSNPKAFAKVELEATS